jgi:hypothetical protein
MPEVHFTKTCKPTLWVIVHTWIFIPFRNPHRNKLCVVSLHSNAIWFMLYATPRDILA